MRRLRTPLRSLILVTALALVVAACGSSKSGNGGTNNNSSSGAAKKGGTFVFGSSADPVSLDPAYISDGESIRITNQVYEGLVATKPGGTEIVPLLAKSWKPSADGKAWTFNLQTGVKFHDGTPFNAAAVCYNFDRWYNFKGVQQSASVSYYWNTVFGGFSDKKTPSLYASCQAQGDDTVTLNLTSPSAAFLPALSLSSFSIASPDALKKYEADKVTGTEDSPKFEGSYGLQHPTGTGPLKFVSFAANDKTVLARNDDYWGKKATLDKVIFRAISDNAARRQALETGEVQGYDNVDPSDVQSLKGTHQVLERKAFNIGYVGFNLSKPPLDKLQIRQAIAYALNRDALIQAKYPPGAVPATQFQPPSLFGWSPDVTKYDYNPEKAKQLIAASGVTNPTLEFWYPTNISRPYMPDPSANFQAFKSDLEKVGFKIVPKSAPWRPDYVQQVDAGKAQIFLLGWTGDYGDPDNFIGVFFRTPQKQWGFNNKDLFSALDKAREITDQNARTKAYQDINKMIMDYLPGVPYVHTNTFLAFAKNVKGYVTSPVSTELFNTVSLG